MLLLPDASCCRAWAWDSLWPEGVQRDGREVAEVKARCADGPLRPGMGAAGAAGEAVVMMPKELAELF